MFKFSSCSKERINLSSIQFLMWNLLKTCPCFLFLKWAGLLCGISFILWRLWLMKYIYLTHQLLLRCYYLIDRSRVLISFIVDICVFLSPHSKLLKITGITFIFCQLQADREAEVLLLMPLYLVCLHYYYYVIILSRGVALFFLLFFISILLFQTYADFN